MPGSEWKRPGDGQSNGVQGESSLPAGWREPAPAERLSAPEVDNAITNLEIAFALDDATRLSSASGGSPADAQSHPLANSPTFKICVGERVLSLGNVWRFVVCGLATLLVVVSLYCLMASTLLSLCLLLGTMFVVPCAVGVLAHTGRLTDD